MKKSIAILLCAGLISCFTACSSDGDVSSNASSNASSHTSSAASSNSSHASSNTSGASSHTSSDSSKQSSYTASTTFDDSAFDTFEKKLKDMKLSYKTSDADAGLANAKKGVTYTFDDGGKVELYLIDDSNLLSKIANDLVLTIEGVGDLPVELNGNLALVAGDAPSDKKDDIINAFKKL